MGILERDCYAVGVLKFRIRFVRNQLADDTCVISGSDGSFFGVVRFDSRFACHLLFVQKLHCCFAKTNEVNNSLVSVTYLQTAKLLESITSITLRPSPELPGIARSAPKTTSSEPPSN